MIKIIIYMQVFNDKTHKEIIEWNEWVIIITINEQIRFSECESNTQFIINYVAFFSLDALLGTLLKTFSLTTSKCFFNSPSAFSSKTSAWPLFFSYNIGTICRRTKPNHSSLKRLVSFCCMKTVIHKLQNRKRILTYVDQRQKVTPVSCNWHNPQASNHLINIKNWIMII